MPNKKEKILIIGGGVAGCTAAYELSKIKIKNSCSCAENQELKYDITLMQMGWKLGGKGSSGRNFNKSEQSEEHGPHVWFGSYDNTWKIAQDIYSTFLSNNSHTHGIFESLRNPHKKPIFKATNQVGFCSNEGRNTHTWSFNFPSEPDLANRTSARGRLVDLYAKNVRDNPEVHSIYVSIYRSLDKKSLDLFVEDEDEESYVKSNQQHEPIFKSISNRNDGLKILHFLANQQYDNKEFNVSIKEIRKTLKLTELTQTTLHKTIDVIQSRYSGIESEELKMTVNHLKASDHFITALRIYYRSLFCLAKKYPKNKDKNLASTDNVAKAFISNENDVFDSLNGKDLLEVFKFNGAKYYTLDSSDFLRSAYDSFYSYINHEEKGVSSIQPSLDAGTGLQAIFWLFFTYKKDACYVMQAGMGEILFSPMYEILKDKVNFKFFHKVTDIEVNDVGEPTKVKYIQQAKLNRSHSKKGYQPLQKTADGMLCWRSEPDYKQLTKSSKPPRDDPGYESSWSCTNSERTTEAAYIGKQNNPAAEYYDRIIMAVPIETLKIIGSELISKNDSLRKTAEKIKTIRTISSQLWLKKSLYSSYRNSKLGYANFTGQQLLSGASGSWDVWLDYSPILKLEQHTKNEPDHLIYGTGVWPGKLDNSTFRDSSYPSKVNCTVGKDLIKWLNNNATHIWEDFTDASGEFDKNLLTQTYVRVNIDPSDLYTTAAVDTTSDRYPSESEDNTNIIHYAGDWVDTRVNLGCVEGAVISGLQAAKALSGENIEIAYPKTDYVTQTDDEYDNEYDNKQCGS